jgi:hypothetical protein
MLIAITAMLSLLLGAALVQITLKCCQMAQLADLRSTLRDLHCTLARCANSADADNEYANERNEHLCKIAQVVEARFGV